MKVLFDIDIGYIDLMSTLAPRKMCLEIGNPISIHKQGLLLSSPAELKS